jgi:hypothetical protein
MRCEYIKNGEICRAHAMHDSKYCFWHNPNNVVNKKEARVKGGMNRNKSYANCSKFRDIKKAKDIKRVLVNTLADVINMDNTISRARTIGYLCRVLLKVIYTADLERSDEEPRSILEEVLPFR